MDKTKREPHQTSDIYYAAYLKVAAVPFLGTRREGTRVFFMFERIENLEDLRTQYYNRVGKVSALTYTDEIRAMKSLVHSA